MADTSEGVLVRETVRENAYLHPGDLVVATAPTLMETILGSCVSVCLWDADRGVGGMNHFVLPYWVQGDPSSTRFGPEAMRVLFEKVVEQGGRRRSMKAKIFGGACVIEAFARQHESLGVRNVTVAREYLRDRGVGVANEDVGGNRGRKIRFHSDTGAAWVRQI